MKYVFIVKDECGEKYRAHGSDFLSGVYEFPDYDTADETMRDIFCLWQIAMTQKANKENKEIFGPETSVFLEPLYSDYFRKQYNMEY